MFYNVDEETLKDIFLDVINGNDSENVDFRKQPSHKISRKPMFSVDIYDCNSVVLLGNGVAALSHYTASSNSLEKLADEFSAVSGGYSRALLIGGEKGHMEKNRKILASRRIPVVGEYCDEFPESCVASNVPRYRELYNKTIIVKPDTKEVVMYSKLAGLKKLH